MSTTGKRWRGLSIALINRIPGIIWLMLYSLLFFSMSTLGYYSGITASQSRFVVLVLAVVFSSMLIIIDDMDRPAQGFIKVSQQPMISLAEKIDADARSRAASLTNVAVETKPPAVAPADR